MSKTIFDETFLNNQVFHEQPAGLLPPEPEQIGGIGPAKARELGIEPVRGEEIQTGYIIQPNGDILFRIYAPGTEKVEVHMLSMEPRPNLVLTKLKNGMHEGVFPYDPTFTGATSTDIIFDGTVLLYPRIPVFWHRNRLVNFIEIPEHASDYILLNNVPHGTVNRELFWSDTFHDWQRAYVYTPPGYEHGTEYPILYLQAGGGENETTWEYNGRMTHILDNTLAEGLCVPMIVAVPDGSESYPAPRNDSISGNQDMLLGYFVPFIESKYKVKKDRRSRALAGLSRGAHQAFATAITHPELFANIGVFSAYMFHDDNDPGDPKYFNKAYLDDAEQFGKDFDIFFRCMGETDFLFEYFAQDNEFFREKGITELPCYRYATYPYKGHLWSAFRPALRDFVQMIFR